MSTRPATPRAQAASGSRCLLEGKALWLLPLLRPSNPRLKGTLTAEAVDSGQSAPGIRAPSSQQYHQSVFLPPLEAATASTEKEPRNPTPALVGLAQRAALGSPLRHPFRGKSGEEVAFQNRRTVHLRERVGSCSSLLWTTPLHLSWGQAAAPEQAGRPYPPPPTVSPSQSPRRPRGSGPSAQAQALSQPPSASTSSLPWPCPWSGGTPLPLAWALSSPAMAPQQKSSGMPPTAPPVLQQAPPLSGFIPGAPDTPNPTAYHGCCSHKPLPISHQST